MSLNIPPRMSLKGYTAYTEAQDFQDLYLHNSSTRHTSFPFFFHLFLYLFLHAITSRQCLMIILYFILFVYFSKATHQTSNQGNKTSPLAFAPLRNCVPIAQILFIYLFIYLFFFSSFTIRFTYLCKAYIHSSSPIANSQPIFLLSMTNT